MPAGFLFLLRHPVGTVDAYNTNVHHLTNFQESLIIGSLLGDGSMRRKKNALLEINHGHRQRAYVDWKYRILASLVATPPKLRKSGASGRAAYRFTTRSLPVLTRLYELFYASNRKKIPHVPLTPLALAVWFMDDGSKSRNAVYFNTQQFPAEDQHRLVQMLWESFGLFATLNRDKIYLRLRLTVASTGRLTTIIGPYLIPNMCYKLPSSTQ